MRFFRNWYPLILIALLIIVAAAGCGPRAAPEDPVAEPEDPAVDEEPEEPEEPALPERVTVAAATGVGSWDPPQCWLSAPEWLIENAYDYLHMKSTDGADWVPQLATHWEIIDDYTHRFYLRDDVKFHDGTDLTAHDVKFHYRRIIEGTREEYILRAQYEWIDKMVIHDDYTIDFVTQEPDALIHLKISQQNNGAGIVSKAYFENVGVEGVHRWPMGSGPWILREHVRDEHVIFDVNEDYWAGRADFDEFEWKVIPEASTRVAELITGGVDLIWDIMPQDQGRIDSNPGTRTLWTTGGSGLFLIPRRSVNPELVGDAELDRYFTTEDPRIREAIELAIDKYSVREIAGGTGEAFRARLMPPIPEANPNLFGPEANLYDPDRARELIAEAGYAPGECVLVMHANEIYPTGDEARVIADMLEEVGLNVDLRLLDTTTFNTEVYFPVKSQELILMSLGGNMNPFFGTGQYHSSNDRMQRYGVFGDVAERLDPLLEYAWHAVGDDEGRMEAFHEASQIIADERFVISIIQRSTLWGMSDRIDYTPRFDGDVMAIDIKKGR